MSFKEQIKEFFIFTKGESRGIVLLLILLFIVIIINLSSEYFIPETEFDFSKYEELFSELQDSTNYLKSENSKYDTLSLFSFNPNNLSSVQAKNLGLSEYQYSMIKKYLSAGGVFKFKSDFKKIYSIGEEQFQKLYPYINLPDKKISTQNYNSGESVFSENKKINYFVFDPNILKDSGWSKLGFSEKQIVSIRNYINSGGKFYKKEDLKKLYVINDKKYFELEPYIKITEIKKETDNKEKINPKVDINNLSAEQMKKYGKFWQYNATRIVKYRNLLGGYYKREQLLEVYGVKKQYYDKIADDITVDKSKLEKININFAEISELGRHPYISYENAKKIIEYRNKNGFINDLKILKSKHIIPPDLYDKISPYLKVK